MVLVHDTSYRFSAEAKAERPQHCYMPFGSGPRNCIGMRFALLEAKMALIEILKKFSFIRAPDTQVCFSYLYDTPAPSQFAATATYHDVVHC